MEGRGVTASDAAWLRLDIELAEVKQRLDALENADVTAPAPRGWKYTNVIDWVEQWFVYAFARSAMTEVYWCEYWWDHTEAVVVLTALWRAWETMRLDRDTGMVKWLAYFAYPLTHELWSGGSTFRSCSVTAHVPPSPLSFVPVPDDVRGGISDVS
jgi:Domain of unknown function (DUF4913)